MIVHAVFAEPMFAQVVEVFDIEGLAVRPAWHGSAACRDHPDLNWFPEVGADVLHERRVCALCPVQTDCSEAGLGEAGGIWGGIEVTVEPVVVAARAQRAAVVAWRARNPLMPRAQIAMAFDITEREVLNLLRTPRRRRAA